MGMRVLEYAEDPVLQIDEWLKSFSAAEGSAFQMDGQLMFDVALEAWPAGWPLL